MNRSRLWPAVAAALLLGLLLLPAAPAMAKSCPLTVSPSSGAPGTRFTFRGEGYTPTELRLTRNNHPTKVVRLQLNDADPWSFSIVASDSDVGKWKAIAVEAGGNCRGTAVLRVTLPPTDALSDMADRGPVVMAISGLAALFVAVTLFMVRRSRRFGFGV
jgi:hypothetical protein